MTEPDERVTLLVGDDGQIALAKHWVEHPERSSFMLERAFGDGSGLRVTCEQISAKEANARFDEGFASGLGHAARLVRDEWDNVTSKSIAKRLEQEAVKCCNGTTGCPGKGEKHAC